MAKPTPNLETNWVRIVIGYNTMVLPWDEGIALFKNLSDVVFVEREYSAKSWKRVKSQEITMHIFYPEEQAATLMEPVKEAV